MFTREEFAKQVGLALEHLHDFVYLKELPLVVALGNDAEPLDSCVRRLQTSLLDTIERLEPKGRVAPRAKERRPYAIVYGHYVQGMTTVELADELAISIRQLRREHKRAVGAIVDLLWEAWQPNMAQLASDAPYVTGQTRHEAAAAEAETLIARGRQQTLSLSELVDGVLSTLKPLAAARGTLLVNRLLPEPLPVCADRVVLRQGLLELVAHALDQAVGGALLITALGNDAVGLRIVAEGTRHTSTRAGVALEVSRRLMTSVGGAIALDETSAIWQAEVRLSPLLEWPVIIADDNAGLIELYRRYLTGYPYRIWPATTAAEVFELLPQVAPALILLDVMMPEQDGWETLIRLRATKEACAVPIVICSVLNEPEIAYSLGASDYLTKPVTQHDLLAMLDQWCSDGARRHGRQNRL